MHNLHQRLTAFAKNDVTHPVQSIESHSVCFDKMFAGKNIHACCRKPPTPNHFLADKSSKGEQRKNTQD